MTCFGNFESASEIILTLGSDEIISDVVSSYKVLQFIFVSLWQLEIVLLNLLLTSLCLCSFTLLTQASVVYTSVCVAACRTSDTLCYAF